MCRNLSPFPNGDAIQRALALEPRINALNGLPLLQERFAFEGVLNAVLGQQLLVGGIQLDDRRGSVSASDQIQEFAARVTSVRHDVARMKLAI